MTERSEGERDSATTTVTTTKYRLVWGDGGERYSDDLDRLLEQASPDFGDYIEYRTITTTTTDWEPIA